MPTRFSAFSRGGTGSPLVLLHGFTDTWRTWDLVRPMLEPHHDVFAPTLVGHAGGGPFADITNDTLFADDVERALDEAGIETAHIVGNSLGGYVALHLAERGRAKSVVALAPAGGWPAGDPSFDRARRMFKAMQRKLKVAAPIAPLIVASRPGRRYATRDIAEQYRHIPRKLLVQLIRGAHACSIAKPLLAHAAEVGWGIDPAKIDCPVRIAWGTEDRILPWPVAASQFRNEWLPNADWVELPGIGHCPQLDVPRQTADLILEHVRSVETTTVGEADLTLQ